MTWSSPEEFLKELQERNPNEPLFLQTAEEIVSTIWPAIKDETAFIDVLPRLVEPERVVMFRVAWVDDEGKTQVNRGYRVQFNSALGPYKGGLRFHPSVKLDTLKFLAFEQIFKNSLTGLSLGGGKGGSDFNPRGRSDREVMAFCQAFMTELSRHVGPDTDVPAGDIGVGGREIGYLFGQYKRLRNQWTGTLTGKPVGAGGSQLRTEATGYGVVYFLVEMLKQSSSSKTRRRSAQREGKELEGMSVAVSGSGNVALYCCEKLLERGAKVLSMSDSAGTIVVSSGLSSDMLEFIKDLKQSRRGRIKEAADKFDGIEYHEGKRPWGLLKKIDIAIPCATQNEVSEEDAKALLQSGVSVVCEAANMPCEQGAVDLFLRERVLFGPAKAANAGGVATSGLEMAQNSQRIYWTPEEVDKKLHTIMRDIHATCVQYGEEEDGHVNYVKGANIGGFIKVAKAMHAQGVL